MKKTMLYLVAAVLLLGACEPTESYFHLIFNITDNVKAVISINTSRDSRASIDDEQISLLSLNLCSEQEQHLKSITLCSETQTIAGGVESDTANIIALQDVDTYITSTPSSFTIAMSPYTYAEGELSIVLEFDRGTQTIPLPAVTLERGMVLNVDCKL